MLDATARARTKFLESSTPALVLESDKGKVRLPYSDGTCRLYRSTPLRVYENAIDQNGNLRIPSIMTASVDLYSLARDMAG